MSESYNIDEYREEIDAALKADPGRLGDVFRRGDDPSGEIASELGVLTSGFVSNYRRHIVAIRKGKIPTKISTALETARAVRGFLKRHEELSDDAQNALKEIEAKCEEVARDDALAEKEEAANKERNRKLERTPGIYVYSYPHYLHHPHILGEDGVTDTRMMMKVGMSEVNVKERIFGQTAAMPEEPKTLYLFTRVGEVRFSDCSDNELLRKTEKQIHGHLEAIGHRRRGDAGGGKEWFLTNKETVKSTANLLDLRTDDEDNPSD